MTDRTPAQTLQDAAFLLRNPLRGLTVAIDPDLAAPLADWLEAEVARLAAHTHPEWQETVAPRAFAVARCILGEE